MLDRMMALLAAHGGRIAYKDESWLMRALGVLLWFTPGFSSRYITTFGRTIYVPSRAWEARKSPEAYAVILAHELVHIADAKALGGVSFSVLYLLPQCLAVFAALAPVSLWFLLALVFLLPIPSPTRTLLEARAYAVTLRALVWVQGDAGGMFDTAKHVLAQFTGGAYYWMDPSGRRARRLLDALGTEGALLENVPIAREIREAILAPATGA